MLSFILILCCCLCPCVSWYFCLYLCVFFLCWIESYYLNVGIRSTYDGVYYTKSWYSNNIYSTILCIFDWTLFSVLLLLSLSLLFIIIIHYYYSLLLLCIIIIDVVGWAELLSDALLEANKQKNRYSNIIPCIYIFWWNRSPFVAICYCCALHNCCW